MGNVQYATPMYDRKPLFGSVMNVTLEHTGVVVLSVDHPVYLMLTIAQNVLD